MPWSISRAAVSDISVEWITRSNVWRIGWWNWLAVSLGPVIA